MDSSHMAEIGRFNTMVYRSRGTWNAKVGDVIFLRVPLNGYNAGTVATIETIEGEDKAWGQYGKLSIGGEIAKDSEGTPWIFYFGFGFSNIGKND